MKYQASLLRSKRLILVISLVIFATFLPGFAALQQSASATATNYSLFSDYTHSATPVFDNPTELGISASTTSAGQITAIRFYQYWNGANGNYGPHVGYVWSGRRGDRSNTLLATKTFPNSTNSPTSTGWVEVALDTPISIAANTNFTVSVSNQNGYYTRDSNPTSKTVGPLSFLGTSYHYRNDGSFPDTNSGTNYGIDFVFAAISVPSAPTALTSTAGNGTAEISFTQGSDGGSAITNYKYSTDGTTYTALSPADTISPVTISGLSNGTSYTIYLKAVNAIGDSVASSSVNVTPVAPAEEPACNAACQAAEVAARNKAKQDADAALAAKKAADAKAKQDADAANERSRLAADQAEKDRLAAEKALLNPEQQAIVEQRSEAFSQFIADLPPIVPVEDLALISSREDLPQYDPASEPEKNSAAQVAGFAAVSVLAAGGAATAMSGSSSSGSSGGGSSSGGGAARTASASVSRREEDMASNKSLLEEIDLLSLKQKQDKVVAKIKPGPGDNSFTWRLPYTQKIEDYFYVTSQKANRFVPLMAKLFADAAYLRAMIGSLSLITFPLAILLGLNALQDVENQALPPTWIVIATIAGLGLIDAFAGFLVSFIYVAGILMAGNLTTLPEILTVLGTTSLFFTPALVATSFRPLRRYTLNWDHRLERIGDYLIASVLTGWTLSKIIATFNVLAGVQLAIVADANKVGIAIGLFVFIRMFAEDMATYFYPQRLGKNIIEFGAPGKVQQLFSLVGKSFMFLLVTQSFVGLNLQLVIGTIFFAIPILVKIVIGQRLPKVKYLNYVLPKGTIRLIVMTLSGTLCAEFSSQFFTNPRDLLTWGFVILSVPGLVISMLGLFADESHKLDWKKSNPGKLVYLVGALVVFYLLSQIALNKNLLVIFQGLLA